MRELDVDLWPAGLVVLLAALAITAMRLLERLASARAVSRTRAALQQAIASPTEE